MGVAIFAHRFPTAAHYALEKKDKLMYNADKAARDAAEIHTAERLNSA